MSNFSRFDSVWIRLEGMVARWVLWLKFKNFSSGSIPNTLLDKSVKWLSLRSNSSSFVKERGGPTRALIRFWDKYRLFRVFSNPRNASVFKLVIKFLVRSRNVRCWKYWKEPEGSSRTTFLDKTSLVTRSAMERRISPERAATLL